ncbi:host specificity protein J [Haemophilus haemolyticus]|uniref:host specificity protein J n=1 Tax=Haemophilus haemolyticus TaxID=726 RepID=UPI001128FDAA|nr:phage tail protein [Haemophilus haemolyticus]TPH11521.1 host specificity protein J [Haemophilus haemolyticus]
MGFLKKIFGGGGGSSGHTPVEAKESGRSKQLVKFVEVISEGEVYGLADGMKSIYFDKTPVQNKDGSYNFKNVQIEGRVGGQVQDLMAGFNTSEKEVGVGTLVKKNLPLTRTVTDSKVSRLRLTIGVQSLFKQEDNGDTNGTSVNFVITIGSRTYPVSISGKYSSQYLQHHTFDNLPSVPFIVKVERTTDDSTTQRLQNNTIWSSYTEIIDTEFTYPNTALIGVKFDSEYFSNIPTRTYDLLGLKVKVPSNYDTRTRQYTGIWDGTFKIDWTDNPAWVLYDVVTNKRYGLGGRLGEFGADKWELYQVAQYCDQLVPDGFGGQEPRFTCNVWLTEQRSAYQVINDICSIFRAMPVWNGQQLTVVMDRPADPVWTYTNANVDESGFSYTFSARKSRHNAIQVEYADKENSYEKAIEYVSDDESIRKNGLNVKKITAFGCTSRGQAHRTALWLLQTEKLETKTVTFTVGAEGLMHIPGDIIKVADTHYAGTNIGGRVLKVEGKKVTLDREINPEHYTADSFFTYINKQAKHQDIRIVALSGAEITLERTPEDLTDYSVWSLTTQKINTQLFRALSVKEEAKGKYSIVALQHEPQKEAIVDNGAKFEPKSTSLLPRVSDIHIDIGTDGKIRVDATVSGGEGTVLYDIRLYKNGNLVEIKLGQKSPEIAFDELEDGDYFVVIQAKNERGKLLSEQTKTFTIDRPPVPLDVMVLGGLGNITISWAWVDDFTQTEIWVSEQDNLATAQRLTKLTAKMYSHEVGAKQVRYYWLRHVRGQNVGAFYQQSGLRGESSVDIDQELKLLNEKLSQNIVNEVIDTALPARNLEMIKTVTGLNVNKFIGYKQVYNTADGKLYTWNGSKYIENGVDVNGIRINTTQLVGTLQADQIGANTIGAGALQAGAVRTEHMAAGQITADKMAIGLGGNLLYNPIFANVQSNGLPYSCSWWGNSTALNLRAGSKQANDAWGLTYYLPEENQLIFSIDGDLSASATVAMQSAPCLAGKWYILSAYIGIHRGKAKLTARCHFKDGGYKDFNSEDIIGYSFNGGLGGYTKRAFVKFKTPSNTERITPIFWVIANSNESNKHLRVARPMLEECTQYATEPSVWQNAGVTSIHGGSIVTNSITAQQIAAGTITGNEIKSGTITAKEIASGTITGKHIAASQTLQSPIIRGGVLEVGSLIGGNLYEFLSISPNGRTASTVVIKPSIAERLLIIKWETGEVRYSNNSVSIMSTDEWVTKIESTHKKSSFYRKGLYTQTIPSNTEVHITLNYFAKNIINPIDIETIVFSGKKYIEVR